MQKDIFTEYKVEWFVKDELNEMSHNKLIKVLKFIRIEDIKKYTISGFNQDKIWKILIKLN